MEEEEPEAWGAVTDCSPSFYKVLLPSPVPWTPWMLQAALAEPCGRVWGLGAFGSCIAMPFSRYVTFG